MTIRQAANTTWTSYNLQSQHDHHSLQPWLDHRTVCKHNMTIRQAANTTWPSDNMQTQHDHLTTCNHDHHIACKNNMNIWIEVSMLTQFLDSLYVRSFETNLLSIGRKVTIIVSNGKEYVPVLECVPCITMTSINCSLCYTFTSALCSSATIHGLVIWQVLTKILPF